MAKKKIPYSSFEDWTSWDVKLKLNVLYVENSQTFQNWLKTEGEPPLKRQESLEEMRKALVSHYASWNEEDLKLFFIAPLLFTVPFEGYLFDKFAHTYLSAKIDDYYVNGYVDWMCAFGKKKPEKPYFFLHEYKQLGGKNPDPEGQLLIAMLAAQVKNNNERPVYGCFVIANSWYFVVLENRTYSISEGFDARKPEELAKIWLILNKTAGMIAEWAEETAIMPK